MVSVLSVLAHFRTWLAGLLDSVRLSRRVAPPPSEAPWMRYAGFVESGDPHSSRSTDEVVYGSNL
jgi:hypothetical protein